MKRDVFLKIAFITYLLSALLLNYEVNKGLAWIALSKETANLIAATIMGVSGSIIGYLVIYLSMSFEAIRSNYGKYALRIFRRDFFIWSLCIFFSLILLLGLTTLLYTDDAQKTWLIAFNLTCLSFAYGVVLIVPFGRAILRKSGSHSLIEKLIADIKEDDFKNIPARNGLPSEIFWAITESPSNKVDVISNILFHHINEGDYKVASQIILDLFNTLMQLSVEATSPDVEKMVFRYLDILNTSFEIAKRKDDYFTLKMVLYGYNSAGILIASKKLGRPIIEKIFNGIYNIAKALIEAEKEDTLTESLWTYYHIAEKQLEKNLPRDEEIWTKDAEGHIDELFTENARLSHMKSEAIDKGLTYNLAQLAERSFLCRNHYLTENTVRMLTNFLEMIIYNKQIGPLQRLRTGSSLCYNVEENIKKLVASTPSRQFGYRGLYVSNSTLIDLLQENGRLSKQVFSTFISFTNYLHENDYTNKFDLDELGGLTRLVIAYAEKITDAREYVKSLLDVQQKIRIHLLQESRNPITKESERTALKEMIEGLQKDLKSYHRTFSDKSPHDKELGDLIDSYQI